jgi:hypothetical protein
MGHGGFACANERRKFEETQMSSEKSAAWHADELPRKLTEADNDNFQLAANDSFAFADQSPLVASADALVAVASTETLSAPDAGTVSGAAPEPAFLSELHNARIRTEVADHLGAHDWLGYHGMLDVLDAAAVGRMTADKFDTLKTLVSLMRVPDGISTSAYVQHISHSLVDGDPANAHWTGGDLTSTSLGDLSANSKHWQVEELIGKWFLGEDLPTIDLKGTIDAGADYEVHDGPLFAAHRAPSYLDVNQGKLGDCWFLATLAEVARQDPSAIKSMIVDNDNGTFGVRFFVDGHAKYVTVDDELPTASKPTHFANESDLLFANGADGKPLWAELVEKAFAQLNAEPGAVHGDTLKKAINAYEGIDDGHPKNALKEITDQDSHTFGYKQLISDAPKIGDAFDDHEEVELFLGDFRPGYQNKSGNLVQKHVFEVIRYNEGTDSFTLHNPWGSTSSDPMTFTMTARELARAGCYMSVAEGAAYENAPAHDMEVSIASHMAAIHSAAAHL